MNKSLCARLGFDDARIHEMLVTSGLVGADNHALVEELQKRVIRPNIDKLVDDFYAVLGQSEEFRRIAPDGSVVDRLKVTQKQYLLTLGKDYDSPGYFEDRLRVGSTHRRVGVSLATYQGFFCFLQTLLIDNVPYTVVGVMIEKLQWNSYSGMDKDHAVIPIRTFWAQYGNDRLANIVLKPLDPTEMKQVLSRVREIRCRSAGVS